MGRGGGGGGRNALNRRFGVNPRGGDVTVSTRSSNRSQYGAHLGEITLSASQFSRFATNTLARGTSTIVGVSQDGRVVHGGMALRQGR